MRPRTSRVLYAMLATPTLPPLLTAVLTRGSRRDGDAHRHRRRSPRLANSRGRTSAIAAPGRAAPRRASASWPTGPARPRGDGARRGCTRRAAATYVVPDESKRLRIVFQALPPVPVPQLPPLPLHAGTAVIALAAPGATVELFQSLPSPAHRDITAALGDGAQALRVNILQGESGRSSPARRGTSSS